MARVLIVSDDMHTAELAALVCRSGGHSIALVDNGLQAIMLLDERPVDVILADLPAARFCAHALARLVRSAATPNTRPAIVAMAERGEQTAALADHDLAGVVIKPLHPAAVRQALMAALGRQTWVEIVQPAPAALELDLE